MEEYLEELEDEARDREVAAVLDKMLKRYITLYGSDPDPSTLSIAEIQKKIKVKMPRPYSLS